MLLLVESRLVCPLTRAVLLAVGLTVACGEQKTADSGAEPRRPTVTAGGPLELTLADPARPPPRDGTRVPLPGLADPSSWTVVVPPGWRRLPADDGLSFVGSEESVVTLRLRRDGPIDPRRFHQVRLRFTLGWTNPDGGAALSASWSRDGSIVGTCEAVSLPRRQRPDVATLEMPSELAGGAPLDGLELSWTGRFRKLGVQAVELAAQPDASRLPDPLAGPQLVPIDHDARLGVGLVSGHPLVTDVPPLGSGRLGFSMGVPAALRDRGTEPVLRVTLTDGDDGVVRHSSDHPLPPAGADWERVTIPLGADGRRLRARFEIVDDAPASAALAEVAAWAASPAPPRVLLVTSDTHRGDHLGTAVGDVAVDTPALDALAARGVVFDDCFAPSNITNPSHTALMTGTHPRDVGILTNNRPLNAHAPTLAEAFRRNGWATAAIVSVRHLGHERSGLGQGFERMIGPTEGTHRAGRAVDRARRWSGELGDRPLFLWLHLFDAHQPYLPPPEFDRRYWEGERDPYDPALPDPGLPEGILPHELAGLRDLDFARAQYRAEITYLDAELGGLLADDRWAGALVAFVGDHGESLGQHEIYFDHQELYPDALHVPLILAGAGIPEGRRVVAPVSHLDLGRTVLDAAGLMDQPFPGRDLLRFADGAASAAARRRPEPRYQLAANGYSAALQAEGHYLVLHLADHRSRASVHAYERHRVELFDREADPDCERDLVHARPEVAADLRRRLIDWLSDAQPRGWVGRIDERAEVREELLQLGYVSEARTGSLWEADDCAFCRAFEGR